MDGEDEGAAAARLVEVTKAAIQYASCAERLRSTVVLIGPLRQTIASLVVLDPDLGPEVEVADALVSDLLATLERLGDFIATRYEVILDRKETA